MSSRPVLQSGVGPRVARHPAAARPGPFRRWATARAVLLALACVGLSGCSGRGSFLAGGPKVGQLKTSLSHLEYENAQLKRSVAQLQQENRSMEDRLVQEEINNGDLTARLDDARNLLRDRESDPDARAQSPRDRPRDFSNDGSRARTLPAGQPARKRRKPPVARIPGQIQPLPADRDDESSPDPRAAPDADRSGLRFDDNLDHHTFYAGPLRWTPIARGTGEPGARVR